MHPLLHRCIGSVLPAGGSTGLGGRLAAGQARQPVVSALRLILRLGLLGVALAPDASAQSVGPAAMPAPPEIKQRAEALVAALNGGDSASAVQFFHSNCVVTWVNAETSRGHDGLQAFQQRMRGGPTPRVETFNCELRLDETVQVFAAGYGALATGAFNERFKQPGGRKIDLQGRWTATLVKESGQWLIVNLQLSVDPFANSVLNLARQAGWVVGVVSLLVGAGVGWRMGRKKAAAKV